MVMENYVKVVLYIEGVNGCENLFPIYTQLLKMIGLIDPSHDVITREEFFADFVIPPDTSIKSIGYNFWMLAHFFMNNMGFNPQQYPQIFKYFNSLETRVEREIEKEKQFFRELESILPQIRDTNDDMVILLNSPNPVEVFKPVLNPYTRTTCCYESFKRRIFRYPSKFRYRYGSY